MNYETAMIKLRGEVCSGVKLGLQNIKNLMEKLGNPQDKLKIIHIAGTNGKGSVANMLSSILSACGLKVGLYTSPHLLDFRERMRIIEGNGVARLVDREYVLKFINNWKSTFEKLDLSFFEITTGMAFKWFSEEDVDIAVIEVGLGGRLDSTNIVLPELSVTLYFGVFGCTWAGQPVIITAPVNNISALRSKIYLRFIIQLLFVSNVLIHKSSEVFP